ncbi:phosphotransferase [Aquitalea magnusonii]|uniref:Hydroxylysine kinase n=1 Tax=Aquitalea magnusonii TaxID=332411 RepID=A0A318JIV3_9NEIS|nr:phosphotransferase [Aquitalea magnusonii]PXX50972.1 Ser/Thr protein kinase RdoA (MazF antagonist) [Aquitalea magnusonii]
MCETVSPAVSQGVIDQLFATAAAPVECSEATALLWQHYRLRGVASPLNSERDANFHIRGYDGREYVLKLSHPAENRAVTDFQSRALLHARAADPSLPIPQLLPRHDGQPYAVVALADGSQRVLRLLSYLAGQPLHQIQRSAAQRRHLGQTLGRLDNALRDYAHPAAHHPLLWDIQHAQRLQPLLDETPDSAQKTLLADWLAHFMQQVQPQLAGLRRQVIHNDLNPHNVLVDPQDQIRTAGLIDFGDMVQAPLINELAVACSYQLSSSENPLDGAGELIAGYHAVCPLLPGEIDLLYPLIMTRLCMTVTITGWRAARYPENRSYILRNNGLSWDGLQRLAAFGPARASAYLQPLCQTKGQA